jgi:hypothetical protein
MANQKQDFSGRFDPSLMELPQLGWQTVTFWASRFGVERDTFVKKLRVIGVRPNFFDLVDAEELFRAIERHDENDGNERKRRNRPR